MTATELLHNNFDRIFIELDDVKREQMLREAYTGRLRLDSPRRSPGRDQGDQ